MTTISKLSDAEIAEQVCRKLGAPEYEHGMDSPQHLVDWLSGLLGRGLTKVVTHNTTRTTMENYFKYLCFDWPAPIMMQKVKEWLLRQGRPFLSGVIDGKGVADVGQSSPNSANGVSVRSFNGETRALYEAFLQVEE